MNVKSKNLRSAFAGFLTGSVNGLFGGGGGMVAVPVLKNILGYDEKRSHATAILVIAPVCAVSALVYILNGSFRADVVIPAAIGAAAGGYIGARLLNFLPATVVKIVFIAVMLTAGVRMLF